jgi:hypothetical protein
VALRAQGAGAGGHRKSGGEFGLLKAGGESRHGG